ncbi:hypothetical protein BH10PLA2_BH10PLA2_26770 [soil metagenome]
MVFRIKSCQNWMRRESNPGPVVHQRRHLRVYLVNFWPTKPCGLPVVFALAIPNKQGLARANRS